MYVIDEAAVLGHAQRCAQHLVAAAFLDDETLASPDSVRTIGSGVILSAYDREFFLTAGHVIQAWTGITAIDDNGQPKVVRRRQPATAVLLSAATTLPLPIKSHAALAWPPGEIVPGGVDPGVVELVWERRSDRDGLRDIFISLDDIDAVKAIQLSSSDDTVLVLGSPGLKASLEPGALSLGSLGIATIVAGRHGSPLPAGNDLQPGTVDLYVDRTSMVDADGEPFRLPAPTENNSGIGGMSGGPCWAINDSGSLALVGTHRSSVFPSEAPDAADPDEMWLRITAIDRHLDLIHRIVGEQAP